MGYLQPCGSPPAISPTPGPTPAPTSTTPSPTPSGTPAPTNSPCATTLSYDVGAYSATSKNSCVQAGGKWKKNQCKPYSYSDDEKKQTKKIKCKKLSLELCECFVEIGAGCKPTYKNGKLKKCSGKAILKERLHGPELDAGGR